MKLKRPWKHQCGGFYTLPLSPVVSFSRRGEGRRTGVAHEYLLPSPPPQLQPKLLLSRLLPHVFFKSMIQHTHARFANCLLDLSCFPIYSCILVFPAFHLSFPCVARDCSLNHVPYLKSQFYYDYIQSLDNVHFQLP